MAKLAAFAVLGCIVLIGCTSPEARAAAYEEARQENDRLVFDGCQSPIFYGPVYLDWGQGHFKTHYLYRCADGRIVESEYLHAEGTE